MVIFDVPEVMMGSCSGMVKVTLRSWREWFKMDSFSRVNVLLYEQVSGKNIAFG